ncbi:hypothetical protein CKO25_01045 [Thiocapsa imhoffii]|uniref:UPF0235 protein CKO25_01045 n=1 Tax=Thiocapsa imhoffii TaxID=382777 RepID=A0A9X0WEI3_9GAMM|nr:DUF167 family protein [Thiocapsa imhoffii]MBK1643261.1 hypothetical protein [Thiocapsa imhoffii]
MTWSRWRGDALELALHLTARATKDAFIGPAGDAYRVAIKAPPREGQANLSLRRFIAKAFGVPPSRVSLIAGARSRHKRVRIDAPRQFPIPIEPPPRGGSSGDFADTRSH